MAGIALKRREFLGALAVLGTGAARGANAPRFTTLDHVQITVPDPAKSAAFYARVFGYPVWKNNQTERRYVKAGPCYIVMDKGQQTGRVDHFSASIADFKIEEIHAYLKAQGIAYRDFPSGRDLSVADPDGQKLELSAENTWAQLEGRTASPEAGPKGTAIFTPTGIDHILVNVQDPEKSAAFYAKVYGPVSQRNNNRIWFQVGKSRVGLLQTPAGQANGVNHFCIAAARFDYDGVTKRLAQAGAQVVAPEVAGAPEFRDPDGFLVQVLTPGRA